MPRDSGSSGESLEPCKLQTLQVHTLHTLKNQLQIAEHLKHESQGQVTENVEVHGDAQQTQVVLVAGKLALHAPHQRVRGQGHPCHAII